MAEKKQRRERLSARDHKRAVVIGDSVRKLLAVLEGMYPTDLELRIAAPAIDRFLQATSKTAAEAQIAEHAAGEAAEG